MDYPQQAKRTIDSGSEGQSSQKTWKSYHLLVLLHFLLNFLKTLSDGLTHDWTHVSH